MLGLRDRRRRVAKLTRGAEPQLEPGESVDEVVQVQTGQSAIANAGAVLTAYSRAAGDSVGGRVELAAGPHVLVATDRHVYAMRLGGGRLLDVGDVVRKVPLAEAGVRFDRGELKLGQETFHVMWGFRPRAERLVAHIEAHRSGAGEGSQGAAE